MQFKCLLLCLLMLGAALHGLLVYYEIRDKLRKHVNKYPILWGAIAFVGALIIAIPVIPDGMELGTNLGVIA